MGMNQRFVELYNDFLRHKTTIDEFQNNNLAIPYQEVESAFNSLLELSSVYSKTLSLYQAATPNSLFDAIKSGYQTVAKVEIQPVADYFESPWSLLVLPVAAEYLWDQGIAVVHGLLDTSAKIYEATQYKEFIDRVYQESYTQALNTNIDNYLNPESDGFSSLLELAVKKGFAFDIIRDTTLVSINNENICFNGPGTGEILEDENGDSYVKLTTGSPIWMDIDASKMSSNFFLDFNYMFLTQSGSLQIFANDLLLATIASHEQLVNKIFSSSLFVDYYDIDVIDDLYIRFLWDGESGSEIVINGVEFNQYDYEAMEILPTPEPTSISLIIIGMILILIINKLKISYYKR
jgi:hypothetical protein